jgi:hypothetical protein
MSYSLYDAAVTPCIQQLGALAGILLPCNFRVGPSAFNIL